MVRGMVFTSGACAVVCLAGHVCGGSPCGDDVRRRGRAHLRGDRFTGGRWWWCLRGCGGRAHLRGLRCGVLAGYVCGVPLADDVPEAWQGLLARG